MIREFHPDDMKEVIRMLEMLRRKTAYKRINPDWPTIVSIVSESSVRPTRFLRVAEHKGKLTGMLLGIAQTLWWQDSKHGARIASDLIFYSLRQGDGARMLDMMVKWAFEVPRVFRIECGISSGEPVDRLERIYKKAGFNREGSIFVLNHPKYVTKLGES